MVRGTAAIYLRRRGRALVVLARGLSQRQARCALAEELLHHCRGGRLLQWPLSLAALREEAQVQRELAEWLLPEAALVALVREMRETGEERIAEWAEDLEVTEAVLRTRLAQLRRQGWRGYQPWWQQSSASIEQEEDVG